MVFTKVDLMKFEDLDLEDRNSILQVLQEFNVEYIELSNNIADAVF